MPVVVLVLISVTSLLVTLISCGVFRRELRSLRRAVEEGHDKLDLRVLGARRRVQARTARHGFLRRAHTRRAFHRAASEAESLQRLNELIAKVEAHRALVAVLVEREQAAIDRLYREGAPDRVAKAADDLQQRRKTERGTHATPEHAEGEGHAAHARDTESMRERTTALPATPGDIAAYSTLVTASGAGGEGAEHEEETQVLSTSALAAALTESAAGGAHRSRQATPRAARSVAVAPPASAPFLPISEVEAVVPGSAVARITPTVVSRQAVPAPARRERSLPPIAPLAYPALIGIEDPEEAARAHRDPDEPTPRRGRAAVLMPVFRAPEGGRA